VARSHRPYVLTTGTGSGKSLAYIVPIVDALLRGGRAGSSEGHLALSLHRFDTTNLRALADRSVALGSRRAGATRHAVASHDWVAPERGVPGGSRRP
jgi:hypothetical protein